MINHQFYIQIEYYFGDLFNLFLAVKPHQDHIGKAHIMM
ncbi:MAG: hypothetical protein ETSY2_20775 [Candidatus Entotheonella gemina]|uniref:Uncharacterized protein n=1 Tax=Candidatus Entotheonella gemina TaxID=1429439 RepID=W4M672_9BACT|nr:MAG: hypothetical protein ETSY2_20775 [Candidatus Entotheonella gemina]